MDSEKENTKNNTEGNLKHFIYRVFQVRCIFCNGYISANFQYFFNWKKGPLSRHLNIFKTFEIIKIDKELEILWTFKVGS